MPRSEPEKRRALGQERTLHPAPERVRAAVFVKHPAFFDACDELQVKYEMLRAHLLDGEPVTTVCAAFGYSRQTFYLLRDRLARRGLAGLRDARPGPVGPRTCTPAVVAFLRAQRADDPALPISVLLDRLQRTHGVRLHRRTVERVMGGGPRKKTPRGGEPVADADACLDPGRFCVAGGPAQAEYERRRAAFLGWDRREGAARPAVLGLAGLAELLTRPAGEWTVHCVAARPSRWTGAVDARMTAFVSALVADLPRVWHDPRTPARDRKRMLRLLVDDVTLLRDDVIRVSIRWRGGATRQIECPLPLGAPDLRRTPAAVVEQVRTLATEQTDAQIAGTLNGRWLRTGTGLPFRRLRVRMLREAYDIDSYAAHLTGTGWLTAPQMAELLDVHPATAKRFARQGVLRAVRADDRGTLLFEPPTGPLPAAHPGKRLRDRRQHPKLVSHVQEGA